MYLSKIDTFRFRMEVLCESHRNSRNGKEKYRQLKVQYESVSCNVDDAGNCQRVVIRNVMVIRLTREYRIPGNIRGPL